jgi:hypothetical protein
MFTHLFRNIFDHFVSCFCPKNATFDEKEKEYGQLLDEPTFGTKYINIQIPKYQFVLLQDN